MTPTTDQAEKIAEPATRTQPEKTLAHIPLAIQSRREWTGRYQEWVHRASCTCGWSAPFNTEMLAIVTLDEHARVRNTAAQFAQR